MTSQTATAFFRITNQVDPNRDVDLGSWTSGNIIQTFSICVISTVGNPNSAPAPYQVRLRNDIAGLENAPFQLVNQNDATQNIQASVDFTDLYTAATEPLSPNVWTAQDKTGAGNNCPNGNNAQLTVNIPEVNLTAVSAGSYLAEFLMEGMGGSGGTQQRDVALSLALEIDPLMQISNLGDVVFPPYLGSGNLQENLDFCVYRNNTGNYQATLYGSGAGDAFALGNGSEELPYSLTYSDGVGTFNVTSGAALTNLQNVFTDNPDCNLGAANNASIQITLTEADINSVTNDTYSGILTIMVAPE